MLHYSLDAFNKYSVRNLANCVEKSGVVGPATLFPSIKCDWSRTCFLHEEVRWNRLCVTS